MSATVQAPTEVAIQGWLDDIELALRGVFTSTTEEDEAFDIATLSLDLLRKAIPLQEKLFRRRYDWALHERDIWFKSYQEQRDEVQKLQAVVAVREGDE